MRKRSNKRPEFVPGAPLYARAAMSFSGVPVAKGERIPERPERVCRKLFRARKATHAAPPIPGFTPGGSFAVSKPKRAARRVSAE